MSKYDALSIRMKEYEDVTCFKLPRKSYILGRIDGNAFHTYTKRLKRPFDEELVDDMNKTAMYLCKHIQNAKFAYVQSDEISILVHEEGIDTQPWFSNKIQKMASIGASKATSKFNQLRNIRKLKELFDYSIKHVSSTESSIIERAAEFFNTIPLAEFDARFWTVPNAIEVYNYFLWRQRDAEKNSISAAAQSVYSHKELEFKNGLNKQEMLFQKGINWNDYDPGLKRGRFIEKVTYINDNPGVIYKIKEEEDKLSYKLNKWNEPFKCADLLDTDKVRTAWEVVDSPIFSQDVDFLLSRIHVPEFNK